MADFYMNHLFITGTETALADFKYKFLGHKAFFPETKETYFESKHEKELLKLRKEKWKAYEHMSSGRNAKAYFEALAEINERYGQPTEEEYLCYIEEKRLKHLDKPPTFCLNALYPVPQDVIDKWGYDGHCMENFVSKSDDPVNYTRDGYRWCLENWGTKSDVCADSIAEVVVIERKDFIAIHFETAGGPAIRWLEKVVTDFKELRFEYSYSAGYSLDHYAFSCGIIVAEDGNIATQGTATN